MYKSSLPVYRFLRVLGIFPYTRDQPGQAQLIIGSKYVAYAVVLFVLLAVKIRFFKMNAKIRVDDFQKKKNSRFQTYVSFIAIDRIEIIQSLEGRFEESVIAYLFLLNISPILIIPMTWIETRKFTEVLNNWTEFEVITMILGVFLEDIFIV